MNRPNISDATSDVRIVAIFLLALAVVVLFISDLGHTGGHRDTANPSHGHRR